MAVLNLGSEPLLVDGKHYADRREVIFLMGTWGPLLYDDDNASDLRDSLALLCKVPWSGDRLLKVAEENYGDCDPTTGEGAIFWLVVADQFERRGIECTNALSTALSVIDGGKDLVRAEKGGGNAAFLKKRKAVLQELAQRFKAPREFRPRVTPRKPPPLIVATGEIYAFPTMDEAPWSPYRLASDPPFKPDGWGALVVLATGRAYDWLPWVALASLTVKSNRKATVEEALRARLIFHSQTLGAGRFVPKPSHARGLGLELLGKVELDAGLVEPHLSTWSIEKVMDYDWTIAGGAFSPDYKEPPRGCVLSTLVKKAG